VSVVSIISAERERYVAYFKTAAAAVEAEMPDTARELLISINNETLAYPYRYVRVDTISRIPDGANKICELWLDPPLDGEPKGFQLGPVTIEIYPFTWCSAQIAFDRPLPDMSKLEAFITKWLDVDDTAAGDSQLARAIHSTSQVETNGQLWYLTIDFGSAPADAMLDLLALLANETMADRIVITSHQQ